MSDPTPQTPQQLREAADRAEALRQENAAKDREIAMLRAGVDDSSPIGKMFVKGYDGEVDPEKIRAAWAEVAPPATAPTPETPAPEPTPVQPADGPTEAEAAAAAARSALAAGSTPPGEEPQPDPWAKGFAERQEVLARGGTVDAADARVWDNVFNAAAVGDERVLHNQGRWYAENSSE
jgi:hypothetical protein